MFGIEYLVAAALLIGLLGLLERTHRRTSNLPRIPFGMDADSEATVSYRRELAELRELAQLTSVKQI